MTLIKWLKQYNERQLAKQPQKVAYKEENIIRK